MPYKILVADDEPPIVRLMEFILARHGHQMLTAVNGEQALAGDPPGELELVDGTPDGGRIHGLMGQTTAFSPDYAPEEMFEIATKLYKKSR